MDLFNNLPDDMTAHIDADSKTIYIHDVPHSLIDCLDRLVSSWRDVVYVNPVDIFEKCRVDPVARECLIQPLFAILASAHINGFEMVAFHPKQIPNGVLVYQDSEGNIRPSLGFDPVAVDAIRRPPVGVSMGMDEQGHTRVIMSGGFIGNPHTTVYIQFDDRGKDDV